MKNIDLSQDELKVLVNLLSQVQLIYKDSKIVNPLIDRLAPLIDVPQPEDVPVQTEEPLTPEVVEEPVTESEVTEPVEAPVVEETQAESTQEVATEI
jgi:hypothetical protein